ncbi:MAG: Tat (Twin-arginine translocation) pathway signal sequence domain protein [Glaciihabitans sp.]|nr:Tat (Twin-arginine translocation) pathway signal sequence domain protein [Glaciihabitans sp.]
MAFPAKYPQLNETALTDEARSVLIRVIRVAFPHPRFPDGPYERTADTILKEAENSTWFRVALTQGLLTLGHLAGGDFRDLDDEDATKVLRRIESTEFFGFVRRTTVLNLYDNEDVWEVLGYEGASVDKGGYVNRGFNDLDWLPEPRVDTYDGPNKLVEIAQNVPLSRVRGSDDAVQQGLDRDTSNNPGRRDAEMAEVKK